MQDRFGTSLRHSRRYSARGLAVRTLATFVAAALLSALLYSLLRSEGITEAGSTKWIRTGKTVLDVSILPDFDDKLLLDVVDSGLGAVTLPDPKRHMVAKKVKETIKLTKTTNIYESESFDRELEASLQQSPGSVSRLRSTVEEPLGTESTRSILCAPFSASTRTVAIIGNGPISAKDRADIEDLDVAVRFNLMNNWQRFREKMDVWIMRYSSEATAGYWGINNINQTEADHIIRSLKGVWLVGGNQSHADRLYKRHPELLDHSTVLMPEAAINKAFAAGILQSPASYPSTGFVGIQAALHCTEARVKLHIYGFNWSRKTWSGHNVEAERAFVMGLQEQGRAVVHGTACEGMRECGEGDVDASCHWSTDGRYMCLRGKPKRWKDMTKMVEESRQQEFKGRQD